MKFGNYSAGDKKIIKLYSEYLRSTYPEEEHIKFVQFRIRDDRYLISYRANDEESFIRKLNSLFSEKFITEEEHETLCEKYKIASKKMKELNRETQTGLENRISRF